MIQQMAALEEEGESDAKNSRARNVPSPPPQAGAKFGSDFEILNRPRRRSGSGARPRPVCSP